MDILFCEAIMVVFIVFLFMMCMSNAQNMNCGGSRKCICWDTRATCRGLTPPVSHFVLSHISLQEVIIHHLILPINTYLCNCWKYIHSHSYMYIVYLYAKNRITNHIFMMSIINLSLSKTTKYVTIFNYICI